MFDTWVNLQLTSAVLALIAAIAAVSILPLAFASSRPKNYPPGPRTVPFLGNLNLIPPTKSFVTFTEWKQKYGPIIGLKFGPANFVVLNNYKDVQELLEKRSAIYSSRPPNHIANTLICPNDTHILFAPYAAGWKVLRKAVQALFIAREINNVLPIQNAEATQTAFDMLCDPENYYQHIQRYTTAVILASVFGQRGEKFESPKVQALYDVQNRFTSLLEPGATPPVDAIPFLKYLPEFLAPWKKAAREIRRDQRALYFHLMGETKDKMEQGRSTGCFMEKLIENQGKSGLDDEHVAYLGGVLMEAGSDTTSSTLLSFLLGLLQSKEVLRKAQADVDRCCGTDRLPEPSDLNSLPYIEACMNETLRWRPVAAGGIPHMLTQTDTYKGYVFPAGTVFFANTWAIHHDEDEYTEPNKFNPDRWINNKFGTTANDIAAYEAEQRKITYSWGSGRRICSGQKLAENSLRLVIAKLVWAFDFEADSANIDTSPLSAYQGGFLVAPNKFPIKIRPRSEKHASVLRDEFRHMGPFFAKFETMK
ncbi:hypothetical protein AJ79_08413 [Helicocarpus griseus UAMH5409]|uniref:Cytochrome P450 n=1 Tax=Helicocarpus griseus UAMH5409 TaxID=1447875 RepID=A0A2B7WTI5_9EURO|nr:hypothetical protein AJ79_08413 [Helicocarpus griseus UAMH5409]